MLLLLEVTVVLIVQLTVDVIEVGVLHGGHKEGLVMDNISFTRNNKKL